MGYLIHLDPECRPRVVADFVSEGDELRLRAWLDVHPEYLELVTRALELADEEPAA